jgi:hypothetical protein
VDLDRGSDGDVSAHRCSQVDHASHHVCAKAVADVCTRIVSTLLSLVGQVSGVISLSVPDWLAGVSGAENSSHRRLAS